MPREEIDFKDPRPSSRELGVEFVGRRLFGDDWIGKLSIADLKLLEQYGPKIEFRNGVEVRTINPCPERIRNRLDRAFGRGVVTRTAESVFFALLYLAEKYGRVFPSLEGLAHLAMCCKLSAVTAIVDLERLGFVTRIRRIRQIKTPLGFTTRQITNAYRVHEPTSGLGLIAMTLFATESNSLVCRAVNLFSPTPLGRCAIHARHSRDVMVITWAAPSKEQRGIRVGVSPYRRAIIWKARGRPASRRTSPPSMCLPCATPSNGTVMTVAPWPRTRPRPSG